MAKFIINSTQDKAARLANITHVVIRPVYSGDPLQGGAVSGYELNLGLADVSEMVTSFETGATLGAVQALAAPIMAALEL